MGNEFKCSTIKLLKDKGGTEHANSFNIAKIELFHSFKIYFLEIANKLKQILKK